MICPYCGLEMKAGVIPCDGRRRPVWSSADQSVPLAGFHIVSLLTSYNIEAFYCQSCQKIIIDTGNQA